MGKISSKYEIEFELDKLIQNEIIRCKNKIKELIDECEVYLFGSMAKGRIKESSDIDLLVLIPNKRLSSEDRKNLRIYLSTEVEDYSIIKREVDIKIYGESDYKDKAKDAGFESMIKDSLVDITNVEKIKQNNRVKYSFKNKGSDLYYSELDYRTILKTRYEVGFEDYNLVLCYQIIERLLKHLIRKKYGEVSREMDLVKLSLRVELNLPEKLLEELTKSHYYRRYENDECKVITQEYYNEIVDKTLKLREYLMKL